MLKLGWIERVVRLCVGAPMATFGWTLRRTNADASHWIVIAALLLLSTAAAGIRPSGLLANGVRALWRRRAVVGRATAAVRTALRGYQIVE